MLDFPGVQFLPLAIYLLRLLVIIGVLYAVISLITRRVSRSIEQSEARIMTSIAQSEARITASFNNVETEQKVTDA